MDFIFVRAKIWQSQIFQIAIQALNRFLEPIFSFNSLEVFEKLVFGRWRAEKFDPMFIGNIFIFKGIDIYNVSGFQLIANWFDLTVDNGIFESQANSRMNTECKIQNS